MPVCIGHEVSSSSRLLFFFFFQAEDGIRDVAVTGVQTCALPILLYVAEDREQSSLDGFWSTITAEQRASIEAVALDMWDPYLASLQNHLPAAEEKIVFDKFHVAGHLGEAVDRVRRREHKALKAEGDERLTGTKYDWLRNPTSMDGKQRREFAELRNSELKTARAWALKETAMSLYNYV